MLELIKEWTDIWNELNKFLELTWEIPFGNSRFQNEKIVIGWMLTPERAYRHAALRIQNRLNALSECETSLKKTKIENKRKLRIIERLNKNKSEDYDLDIELLELELSESEWKIAITKKMVTDAIIEVNELLPIINSVWKLSKEDFEAWEKNHFAQIHTDVLQWNNDSIRLLSTINDWDNDLYNKIIKWETNLKLEK